MNSSSSAFVPGKSTVPMKLVRGVDFLSAHSIDRIDLMKVNIEGANTICSSI